MDWISLSNWAISIGGILHEPVDALGNLISCSSPHVIAVGKCAINFGTEVVSNFFAHIPYIGV